LNHNLENLLVVHDLGQKGLAGDIFMIQNKWTLLKYSHSIISSIETQSSSKLLSIDFLDRFPYPSILCSEYVLLVNCGVIVCFFTFLRLDDNESKDNGPRSQPRNGDRDYTSRDEDEDCYDIAQPGKPSLESYQLPSFQIA
jgi:hypothetical protein